MNTKIAFISLFALSMGISFADDIPRPELVLQSPRNVFVPLGFDNNDSAQLVLDGILTSTCYKAGPATAVVDHGKKTIVVSNKDYLYPGSWCAEIVQSAVKVVELGILQSGQYEIYLKTDLGTRPFGKLPVATTLNPRSPWGADSVPYAPVTEAFMERPRSRSNRNLVLRGYFPNGCMRMKEVKLNYKNDVVEVLPIVEVTSENCVQVLVPFEVKTTLSRIPVGRHLVHVRSMSGKAINQIHDF